MHQCRSIIWTAVLLCGSCWPNVVVAQEEPTTENSAQQPVSEGKKPEPSAVPCFEAIERKSSKQLEDEAFARLPQADKAWLTEDVTYIIEAGERCAFLKLETDDEREQFIEQFWLLHNNNPESQGNGFKEEHYRRIVFANEKFGTEIPGWRSDRGHAYILFGPPDTIDSHARGELTGTQPVGQPEPPQGSWEKWHYRYLEGFGENIDLEFIDPQESGDYRFAVPLQKKESLGYRWVDWKDYESTRLAPSSRSESDVWIGPVHVPRVRFKDLEGMVAAQIIRDQVYFSERTEYVKATHASTMTRIFLDIPGNEPSSRDDRDAEGFEVFGRISKLSGRVVDTFERVSLAEWRRAGQVNLASEVTVALVPGPYRLAVVVKDLLSGKTGVIYTPLDVPTYEELDLAN
jgi:GWxTD domain-containing protein